MYKVSKFGDSVNQLFSYSALLLLILVAACNEYPEVDSVGGSKSVIILPNPAEVGQAVTIAGSNFKSVTEVVFPGNVSVSAITHVGEYQINMVVPAGADNGNITLKSSDGDIHVPEVFRVLKPAITSIVEKTGKTELGPNDVMIIRGKDLEPVVEVIFPGNLSVKSIDFIKKINEAIQVTVPRAIQKDFARVQIVTVGGQTITSQIVNFYGEGYVVPYPMNIFCGEGAKVWTWDDRLIPAPATDDVGNIIYDEEGNIVYSGGQWYGMGDGRNEEYPSWWRPPESWYDPFEGLGATMTFSTKNNTLIKERTDGSRQKGQFSIDLTAGNPTWSRSIGTLTTIGVSALQARTTVSLPTDDDLARGIELSEWMNEDGTRKVIDVFQILRMTEDQLILGVGNYGTNWSFDEQTWGGATLWVFRPVEPEH